MPDMIEAVWAFAVGPEAVEILSAPEAAVGTLSAVAQGEAVVVTWAPAETADFPYPHLRRSFSVELLEAGSIVAVWEEEAVLCAVAQALVAETAAPVASLFAQA